MQINEIYRITINSPVQLLVKDGNVKNVHWKMLDMLLDQMKLPNLRLLKKIEIHKI